MGMGVGGTILRGDYTIIHGGLWHGVERGDYTRGRGV